MYKSFRPGKIWYDTSGKRIQAHGGSLLYLNDTFYWYGENKEGITGLATGEKCPYWHHGVRLYSSKDLYNWVDEGIIMKESTDKNNPFYPGNIMDRPHIIFNKKSNKFVMWSKTSSSDFGKCGFSICIGDDIHNFTFVKQIYPNGLNVGDFDLFEFNNKAYVVFEQPHSNMVLNELSDDYTDVKENYILRLQRSYPPFVREAPAFFERKGRLYLLTSGTTGYYPNKTCTHDITDLNGKWIDLKNPCIKDKNKNSFHAQFSSVFKHPNIDDLYIAIGDRWLTDLVEDLPDMDKEFKKMFDGKSKNKISREELDTLTDDNTSEANYVFLPITFDKKGNPKIKYLREWKI